MVYDRAVIDQNAIPESQVRRAIDEALRELHDLESRYRPNASTMLLSNRTVILVDDVPEARHPVAWHPLSERQIGREQYYVEASRVHPREW